MSPPEAWPVTIAAALRQAAAREPDKVACRFLGNGTVEEACLSYSALHDAALVVATELARRGLRQQPVLVIYPPGLDFIVALMGCFLAGAIAVPAPFLMRKRSTERMEAIARDVRPGAVLAPSSIVGDAARPGVGNAPWIATDMLAAPAQPEPLDIGEPAPAAIALVQYTSGSTGDAKGIVVTHANLAANLQLIARKCRHRADLVLVSWLPAYHDMGLIGGIIQPIYVGGTTVLLSPLSVLQHPVRWLQAISRYRANTSPAPNFGYAMCLRHVSDEQLAGLDLRCWTVAICGAEPVRADVADGFVARFAACGFARSSFAAAYGLAEATLMVTCEMDAGPRVRSLDTAALGRNVARPAQAGQPSTRVVASGVPTDTLAAVIVDPETLLPVTDEHIGEIWLTGGSVAAGYWQRPAESEAVFRARRRDGDPAAYLRTGDLGFVDAGGLFVTGRLKDLLIIRGQNIYPQDVEAAVQASHPDLAAALTVAFSVEVNGEEALVVAAELARSSHAPPDGIAIATAVMAAVSGGFGAKLHDLVLVRRGSVPLTTSGKVRRNQTRQDYLAKTLRLTDTGPRHPLLGR